MRAAHYVFHIFQAVAVLTIVVLAYFIQVRVLGLVGGGGGLGSAGAPAADPVCFYPLDDGGGGLYYADEAECSHRRFRDAQLDGRLPLFGNGTDPQTAGAVPRWDFFAAAVDTYDEDYERGITAPGEFYWYTMGANTVLGFPNITQVSVWNDTASAFEQVPLPVLAADGDMKALIQARGSDWRDGDTISAANAKKAANENWPKFHVLVKCVRVVPSYRVGPPPD